MDGLLLSILAIWVCVSVIATCLFVLVVDWVKGGADAHRG